jgi:uncharacterized protein YndB with AHSA1/START domain
MNMFAGRTGVESGVTSADRSLRLRRVFEAPREQVFRAFTEPDIVKRWWGPQGWTITEVEIEPRPGGRVRWVMDGPGGASSDKGGFVEAFVAPELFAYQLIFPGRGEETPEGVPQDLVTRVTIEFHDREGMTEIVLTHEGFDDVAMLESYHGGWSTMLDKLPAVLAQRAAPAAPDR